MSMDNGYVSMRWGSINTIYIYLLDFFCRVEGFTNDLLS